MYGNVQLSGRDSILIRKRERQCGLLLSGEVRPHPTSARPGGRALRENRGALPQPRCARQPPHQRGPRGKSLPLMREVAFAKQMTEGENERREQAPALQPPLKREVARRKPRRRVSSLLFAETPSHRLRRRQPPFQGGLDGGAAKGPPQYYACVTFPSGPLTFQMGFDRIRAEVEEPFRCVGFCLSPGGAVLEAPMQGE